MRFLVVHAGTDPSPGSAHSASGAARLPRHVPSEFWAHLSSVMPNLDDGVANNRSRRRNCVRDNSAREWFTAENPGQVLQVGSRPKGAAGLTFASTRSIYDECVRL